MSRDVQIPVDCLINVSPRKCLSIRSLQAQKPAVINVTKCLGSVEAAGSVPACSRSKEGSRGTGLVTRRKSAGVGNVRAHVCVHVRVMSNVPLKREAGSPRGMAPAREKDTLRLFTQLSVPFRKPSGSDAVRCLGAGRESHLFHTFVNQKYVASPREALTLAGIRGQRRGVRFEA